MSRKAVRIRESLLLSVLKNETCDLSEKYVRRVISGFVVSEFWHFRLLSVKLKFSSADLKMLVGIGAGIM